MAFRIPLVGFPTRTGYLIVGVSSESPVAISTVTHDHDIADEPIFFSPDRLLAKKLIFRNPDGLVAIDQPIAAATFEYARMTSPAGVNWVYGLNNDGTWYLEEFESGSPSNRRVVFTVMHKGANLWVADNRIKPPTGGW